CGAEQLVDRGRRDVSRQTAPRAVAAEDVVLSRGDWARTEADAPAASLDGVVAILRAREEQMALLRPAHPDLADPSRARVGDGSQVVVAQPGSQQFTPEDGQLDLGPRALELPDLQDLPLQHRDLAEEERLAGLPVAGAEDLAGDRLRLLSPDGVRIR